jgi:hypothetical protein
VGATPNAAVALAVYEDHVRGPISRRSGIEGHPQLHTIAGGSQLNKDERASKL